MNSEVLLPGYVNKQLKYRIRLKDYTGNVVIIYFYTHKV